MERTSRRDRPSVSTKGDPTKSRSKQYLGIWCNMTPKELYKIAEKDQNIEEIIVPDAKRKVYFDVDCYGDVPKTSDATEKSMAIQSEAKAVLSRSKAIIGSQFPECRFQISGSAEPVRRKGQDVIKYSNHIVLSNYFLETHDAGTRTLLIMSRIHEDKGFDISVYSKNAHLKTMNQRVTVVFRYGSKAVKTSPNT